MKSTTKSSYKKELKQYTSVSSPETTDMILKQVTNLIEENNNLKYSIDNGETYKSMTEELETQITNIINGTTTVENATNATYSSNAINSQNAVYANRANFAESATTATTAATATNANYATSAGNASTANSATNASTANSATNDSNGDNIIATYQKRRILVSTGTQTISSISQSTITILNSGVNLLDGNVYEIEYALDGSVYATGTNIKNTAYTMFVKNLQNETSLAYRNINDITMILDGTSNILIGIVRTVLDVNSSNSVEMWADFRGFSNNGGSYTTNNVVPLTIYGIYKVLA